MKASCEAGLRQAKSDLQEESQRRPNENVKIINKSAIERRLLPWDVAERMEANINRIGQSSVGSFYYYCARSLTIVTALPLRHGSY